MSLEKIEAKVVVIGAQNVGKTSLTLRYIGQKFGRHLSPTIGASFVTNTLHLNGTEVKLLIWDTAGQERFKSMTPMYYRNANAAIIVFDLSCEHSFILSKRWSKDLLMNVDYSIELCLVGNKCDLKNDRKISREKAEEYAYSINAHYFETSALTNEGINDVFLYIANALLIRSEELATKSRRSSVQLEKDIVVTDAKPSPAQSSCC